MYNLNCVLRLLESVFERKLQSISSENTKAHSDLIMKIFEGEFAKLDKSQQKALEIKYSLLADPSINEENQSECFRSFFDIDSAYSYSTCVSLGRATLGANPAMSDIISILFGGDVSLSICKYLDNNAMLNNILKISIITPAVFLCRDSVDVLPKNISGPLKRANIMWIEQLKTLSECELLNIRGLGITKIKAIREFLSK